MTTRYVWAFRPNSAKDWQFVAEVNDLVIHHDEQIASEKCDSCGHVGYRVDMRQAAVVCDGCDTVYRVAFVPAERVQS